MSPTYSMARIIPIKGKIILNFHCCDFPAPDPIQSKPIKTAIYSVGENYLNLISHKLTL